MLTQTMLSQVEYPDTLSGLTAETAQEIDDSAARMVENLRSIQRLWKQIEPTFRKLRSENNAERGLTNVIEEMTDQVLNMPSTIKDICRIVNQVKRLSYIEKNITSDGEV